MSDNVIPFRTGVQAPGQTATPGQPADTFDTNLLRSAMSLLRVGVCAFAEGDTPFFTDTTLKDVLEVVCVTKEYIDRWSDKFDCDASGDIFIALDVLKIIEATLRAGLDPSKVPIQGSMRAAAELLERGRQREVRAMRGPPRA